MTMVKLHSIKITLKIKILFHIKKSMVSEKCFQLLFEEFVVVQLYFLDYAPNLLKYFTHMYMGSCCAIFKSENEWGMLVLCRVL